MRTSTRYRLFPVKPSIVKEQRVVVYFQTYSNHCVRVGHHGNQHVQQDDNVDHAVRAEHEQAPEAREALDAGQVERLQVDEAERSPEKGL